VPRRCLSSIVSFLGVTWSDATVVRGDDPFHEGVVSRRAETASLRSKSAWTVTPAAT